MSNYSRKLKVLGLCFSTMLVSFAEPTEEGASQNFVVDGIYYNIISESDKTVEVTSNIPNGYSGTIIIPTAVEYNGVTYDVIRIGERAFTTDSNSETVCLYIPESVTSVDEYAFYQSNVRRMTFPESLASQKLILHDYSYGFTYTLADEGVPYSKGSTLEDNVVYSADKKVVYFATTDIAGDIEFPSTVEEIGKRAFEDCENITSVKFPSNIRVIGENAFTNCSKIPEIELSNTLTEIGDAAFKRCTSITNVVWPESVTKVNEAVFSHCIGLQSVKLPDTVTEIGEDAFAYCEKLTALNLPDKITKIGGSAFCETPLVEIVIPKGVTEIASCLFMRCPNLKKVVFPENIVLVEEQAFDECYALEELWCYASIPPKCEDDWIFNGVDKSKCILYVPEKSIDYYKMAYGWNWINVKAIDENGLNGIEVNNAVQDDVLYNIKGQKVVNVGNHPSGLYISKGRKLIF